MFQLKNHKYVLNFTQNGFNIFLSRNLDGLRLEPQNIIKHKNCWLAIDPKGIIGEMAFEAAAFDLLNKDEEDSTEAANLLKSRIQLLATSLKISTVRLTAWIFLKIMLSIQWFIEDQGDPTRMLNAAHSIYPLLQNAY